MPFALVLFLPAKSALFVLTCRAITTDAFLPSYTRPFRDAYKNVLNALLAPSELAWPFKTLAPPACLASSYAKFYHGLYLVLVHQPLYTCLGALNPDIQSRRT